MKENGEDPRNITDSLNPVSVPVITRFRTYHQPDTAAANANARGAKNTSATPATAARKYAFVSNPSPSAAPKTHTFFRRSASQITAVYSGTARLSFPTRAVLTASSGISDVTAAAPSAIQSSANAARPIRNTSGTIDDASRIEAQRSRNTCVTSEHPRATHSTGVMSQ